MNALRWFTSRDRGLAALRRAARTAIVMPIMFAIGTEIIGDPQVATFAAFGSFALLLLVDFAGPMVSRLQAQAALGVAGAVLVCLGTVASRNTWIAAAAMVAVGFAVLFSGVISSVLAGASTSLLLSFILAVTLPGDVDSIPTRLLGWGMASAASILAIGLLWPSPTRDLLRTPAAQACRAVARRLRSEVALSLDGADRPSAAEHEATCAEASAAVAAVRRTFLATPYRPTGLSTSARTIVRLVDELTWLDAILDQSHPAVPGSVVNVATCSVKSASAAVLEHGADLLESPTSNPESVRSGQVVLKQALDRMETEATSALPVHRAAVSGDGGSPIVLDAPMDEFVSSLDPSFRAQELSFAVSVISDNIDASAAAQRRTWWQRVMGHQPEGLVGPFAAAGERAAAHAERHSVWLHNSVRGAIGLGVAVFIARQSGLEHSFWVVLGTLSVLRSNALNTGQNLLRALLGTILGFVIGALLLAAIGTDTTVLWFLLPLAILAAGVAPAVISFIAGQAAFTLTVVILFNIVAPDGWRVGLLRVEDVAIGCAISGVVGLLFWPRGAGAAFGRALAEAYEDGARYLTDAVDYGVRRCDASIGVADTPSVTAVRAAAASRRLDDAFRTYLAELGPKGVPLAQATGLVTGTVALRLAADAVLDLWQRDDGRSEGDRTQARQELVGSGAQIRDWYTSFAADLVARRPIAEPIDHDKVADARLIEAVRHDLGSADGRATATAVRIIWTADHLDAARRLQVGIVEPAREAVRAASRRFWI